jgi:hypothetical protein
MSLVSYDFEGGKLDWIQVGLAWWFEVNGEGLKWSERMEGQPEEI